MSPAQLSFSNNQSQGYTYGKPGMGGFLPPKSTWEVEARGLKVILGQTENFKFALTE